MNKEIPIINRKSIDDIFESDIKHDRISITEDKYFIFFIGTPAYKEYVCKIISSILNLDYNDLLNNSYYEPHLLKKRFINDKAFKGDSVLNYKGTLISLEMNNTNKLTRNVCYAYNLAMSDIKSGSDDIKSIRNVIQININNFMYEDQKHIIEEYKTMDKYEIPYLSQSFVNVSLPLLSKKDYTKYDERERTMRAMFTSSKELANTLGKGDEVIMDFNKRIGEENPNELEMLADVIGFSKLKDDFIEQGKEKGREEGREELTIEVAKSLLQDGFDESVVQKHTKLSLKKIAEIKLLL